MGSLLVDHGHRSMDMDMDHGGREDTSVLFISCINALYDMSYEAR